MKRILVLFLALCALALAALAETNDNPFWGRYTYETVYVTGLVSDTLEDIAAAKAGHGVEISEDALTFFDDTGEEEYSYPDPEYTLDLMDEETLAAAFDAIQFDDPALRLTYDTRLTYTLAGEAGHEIFFAQGDDLWMFTIGDTTPEGQAIIRYVFRLIPAEGGEQ